MRNFKLSSWAFPPQNLLRINSCTFYIAMHYGAGCDLNHQNCNRFLVWNHWFFVHNISSNKALLFLFEILILLQYFPFLFLPPNSPISPSYSPTNSWPHFSLNAIVCIYVYANAYIFLNIIIICCALIVLLVCIFSGLIVYIDQSVGVHFSHDSLLSHSKLYLVDYSFLCRVKASWSFFIHFGMFSGYILVQLSFGKPCWWDFMGITQSELKLPNPLALTVYLSTLLQCPLSRP